MKPIIGIVEWPYFDKDDDQIFEVPVAISNKIIKHGGIPLGIFPPIQADFASKNIKEIDFKERYDLYRLLGKCDAIIKPGAIRIYNYERLIYDYAVCMDMPFLGICAGMQLMAHFDKLKIEDNIKNHSNINHYLKPANTYAHKIIIDKDSMLFKILGKEQILVNSKHHYHVKDSGKLKISALSEDGYIEAIENKKARFQLGVQWHPELLDDMYSEAIFDSLIEHAKVFSKRII